MGCGPSTSSAARGRESTVDHGGPPARSRRNSVLTGSGRCRPPSLDLGDDADTEREVVEPSPSALAARITARVERALKLFGITADVDQFVPEHHSNHEVARSTEAVQNWFLSLAESAWSAAGLDGDDPCPDAPPTPPGGSSPTDEHADALCSVQPSGTASFVRSPGARSCDSTFNVRGSAFTVDGMSVSDWDHPNALTSPSAANSSEPPSPSRVGQNTVTCTTPKLTLRSLQALQMSLAEHAAAPKRTADCMSLPEVALLYMTT